MTMCFRWLIVGCCWLWTLPALLFLTDAGLGQSEQMILFVPVCLLFICWLWHSIRFPNVFKGGRVRWPWISVPLALMLLSVLGKTDIGLTCRVWLSQRELRAFAEAALPADKDVAFEGHGKLVGLFYVHKTETWIGTEVRLVTSRGFCNSYGIIYWPDGIPDAWKGAQHLYGPWYRYEDDF